MHCHPSLFPAPFWTAWTGTIGPKRVLVGSIIVRSLAGGILFGLLHFVDSRKAFLGLSYALRYPVHKSIWSPSPADLIATHHESCKCRRKLLDTPSICQKNSCPLPAKQLLLVETHCLDVPKVLWNTILIPKSFPQTQMHFWSCCCSTDELHDGSHSVTVPWQRVHKCGSPGDCFWLRIHHW